MDKYSVEWFKETSKNYTYFLTEAEKTRRIFLDKYSLDILRELSGKDLLEYIYLNGKRNELCYALEYNTDLKKYYGSIKGGNAIKHGLYFSDEKSAWVKGTPNNLIEITEEEAIEYAVNALHNLMEAVQFAHEFINNKQKDYNYLHEGIYKISEGESERLWFLKYLELCIPDLFSPVYVDSAQKTILNGLGITPGNNKIQNMKLLRDFADKCELDVIEMCGIFWTESEKDNAMEDVSNNKDEEMDNYNPFNNTEFGKNMILYGPPGTGKTFSTAKYAVAICDGYSYEEIDKMDYSNVMNRYRELFDEQRIAFTTFHQSYGYEEFIEGIRPKLNSDEIGYSIEPGVFLDFCSKARMCTSSKNPEANNFEESWSKLVDAAFNNGNKYLFRRDDSNKSFECIFRNEGTVLEQQFEHSFIPMRKERIYEQWSNKDYEKVGDWRKRAAVVDTLKREFGLKDYTDETESTQKQNYVFIIDEINRGNISKIFGELITLIEDTKREGKPECRPVVLPYSKKPFAVPDNVYILGTMNTADRSIALLDTALRRRFSFKEMMPDKNVVSGVVVNDKGLILDVADMLETINKRIEFLFDREHTIGHAFFTPLIADSSMENLGNIFKNKIIPLLQEYFYEDYEKIRLVLGDNGETNTDFQFITKEEPSVTKVFKGSPELDEKPIYKINEKAFSNIESYKKVI